MACGRRVPATADSCGRGLSYSVDSTNRSTSVVWVLKTLLCSCNRDVGRTWHVGPSRADESGALVYSQSRATQRRGGGGHLFWEPWSPQESPEEVTRELRAGLWQKAVMGQSQCRRGAGETALKWGCLCVCHVCPPRGKSTEGRRRACPPAPRAPGQVGPPQQDPLLPLRSPRGPLGPTPFALDTCSCVVWARTRLRLPTAPREWARFASVFLLRLGTCPPREPAPA